MKESISAYSKQKSITKKALRNAGFENIKVSNGHYYFSGFATKNNQVIYFSISDRTISSSVNLNVCNPCS